MDVELQLSFYVWAVVPSGNPKVIKEKREAFYLRFKKERSDRKENKS